MADICYITILDAVNIHRETIKNSGGGALGHFDLGRLESVLQNIQNDEYYPTFADKLTHLFFCTCEFHCFEDGNKRIAITLSAHFLLINGYMSVARTFLSEMENISYHVAAGKIDKALLLKIMNSILKG
ncbi:MAG: type II toxin-antitoxin system death-on-curing family toxin, partial [Oscillospiraceae bacterium]